MGVYVKQTGLPVYLCFLTGHGREIFLIDKSGDDSNRSVSDCLGDCSWHSGTFRMNERINSHTLYGVIFFI